MRIDVFHPGTQNSWQRACAFQESGQLAWYATSVFYDPGRWPYRMERYLPKAYAARIQRECLEHWQEASWALREKRSRKVYRQSIRKLFR